MYSKVALMICFGRMLFLVPSIYLQWKMSFVYCTILMHAYCFAWEGKPVSFHVSFSSDYPFPVTQLVGSCQNGTNIRTSLFCSAAGRGGGEKCWVQLKIMRVEGFSSGVLLHWTWRTTCSTSTYTSLMHHSKVHSVSIPWSATNNTKKANAFDLNLICKIIK